MFLGISTNSFHYKYYKVLRSMWDMGEKYGGTNLCSYTQFLFWFSLLTFVAFPLILGGWLLLKIGRGIYKVCSWTSWGRSIIDILDEIGLGNKIDTLSDRMQKHPAVILVLTFVSCMGILFLCFFAVGCLIGGIVYIKLILIHALAFLMMVGVGIFYIGSAGGWVLAMLWGMVAFVLKFLATLAISYSTFLIFFMVGLAVVSIISLLAVKIITASDKLMEFLGFQLNGYQQARTRNSARRKQEDKERAKEALERKKLKEELARKKALGEIPYTFIEKAELAIGRVILSSWRWFKNFFIARTSNVKGGTFKVLGVIGILWEVVKSVKHGVCPLIEFVEEETNTESN